MNAADKVIIALFVVIAVLMGLTYKVVFVGQEKALDKVRVLQRIKRIKSMNIALAEFAEGMETSIWLKSACHDDNTPPAQIDYLFGMERLADIIVNQTDCISKEIDETVMIIKDLK